MVAPPETRFGDFCWAEHASAAPEEAKSFYASLFGWQEADLPAAPVPGYAILALEQQWMAGVWPFTEEQQAAGHPSRWIPFVRVADLAKSLAKIVKRKGRVQGGKRAVPGFGRAAVVKDPQGVVLALWQPDPLPAADYVGSPGQPCWFELGCPDAVSAARFYADVFGWDVQPAGADGVDDYWIIRNQGLVIGGLQEMGEAFGGAPAHCTMFLAVRDCDETILDAKDAGAFVAVVPTDIPGVGRQAVLEDPSGAMFGILEPE
ncbi:MAG: VOC family protein [Planctomycetota bacterium]